MGDRRKDIGGRRKEIGSLYDEEMEKEGKEE